MKWFDSLFARIFLLQLAAGLLLAVVFSVLLFNEQASIFARATAPLWVSALQPVRQQLARGESPRLPRTQTVTSLVELQPGPPPDDARVMPLIPRYRALLSELRAQGLPVASLAVSGRTGRATTWLELQDGDKRVWVGVRGMLEGPDIRRRGTLGFVIALLVFVAGAAWLSRRIARPLQDLQASVKAFAATGRPPLPADAQGPAEVRQLTRQFAEFAAQRTQQDEARDMMLAGISHDLRSPLGRIRMAAELLPDAPGVRDKQASIVRNVQAADRLVGAFLDLARASAEPLDERVDLAALTRRLLDSGDHEGVRLELLAAGALWLQPASSAALERLLVNLLDNAAKYGQPPVVVSLQASPTHAVLTVRDHGAGIAPGQMDALRKAFFRGSHDRGLPGTGLGLAIAERSVQRHGGEMTLLDAGPGLAVQLRFPLAAEP
ncbi:sensor histidine kinase [Polaromonas hydrogenivorans]|uniref:histidine kinase n=1 Tax=Polaromonas hydrogenivorans TaxID=335476 RepID=A0AAU7LR92_9BURK